jgi:hypothetical protein
VIQNTDGEPVELHRLVFDIDSPEPAGRIGTRSVERAHRFPNRPWLPLAEVASRIDTNSLVDQRPVDRPVV